MSAADTFAHLDESAIAIIGMVCRFPKAKNVDEYWQKLRDGVELISFFSDQELESSGVDPAVLNDPNYVKAAAVLEDAEMFDASFFGYNPREAEIIDPQHRLFLECAWQALESAGYDSERYEGLIGVYGGAGMNTYFTFNLSSNPALMESVGDGQIRMGNRIDNLATRVSYKLNLRGPSFTVQTGCSTSLVAVHLACQSLLNGECDMALAGGVRVSGLQKVGYFYQEGGIESPDGHCRAFDAQAKGTVGGNGLGLVVLKRLSEARADGDHIHAVIKGSAINNDGSLKVGYTAPSVDGQAKVISEALAMSGVEPETITYVEAHGTGTILGDPIEIAGLTQAFRASTEKKGFCAIGSVKTNMGHTDTAAGVAGLIKTVLALEHKLLPPSLHFERPNPTIDFENSPFYVNAQLKEWKTEGILRRAGVSSFGVGGTNAHAILEEAPLWERSGESRPAHLLMLSAKTSSALETMTSNLAEYLKQHPTLNLANVAYTLGVGRRAFSIRRTVVCRDLEDAVSALETVDPRRVFTAGQVSKDRPVAFMFSGQGAQYVNMALELYQVEASFRDQIDHCSKLLAPHLGLDLRQILFPSEEKAAEATEQLKQTSITQPALFVIEYALAKLWMEWGVHPQAMIGHSIGEYVAACLAGVFSLEDALALVAARGRMMQQLPGGAMLSVPLAEKDVQSLLGENLSLAAVNGPSLSVVSGPEDAIDALEQRLTEQEVNCRRLHTSHAFHSKVMDSILEPFAEQVRKLDLKSPKIPYISNVTGTWIKATEATDPSYWARHLRQTVRFAEGLHELLKESERVLLEVGPGQTLSTLARQHPEKTTGHAVFSSIRHVHDQYSDVTFLLNTLG
ncbi:MAG: type I polyketide synthase, partial [Acidobacteria bacterium]|nr:type I polyketide synthase [Acidobacteriota bacterium]